MSDKYQETRISSLCRVTNSIAGRKENPERQKELEEERSLFCDVIVLACSSRFLATSATLKDPQTVLAKRGNVRPSRHPRLLERIQRSGFGPTMLMVSSLERL